MANHNKYKRYMSLNNAQQIRELEEILGFKLPVKKYKHIDKYFDNVLSWKVEK